MARRTIEQTRTLLLETAAAMLIDSERSMTIGKLDLLEVCRRAGLSSAGSAYKIWPTQDAYRADLLHHILGESFDQPRIDEVTSIIRESTDLPPLDELIRNAAILDDVTEEDRDRRFSLYIALWLAAPGDPALARELHDSDARILDDLAVFYGTVVARYGLEWVEPYDARLFATMVSAMTEGMAVEAHSQPEVTHRTLLRRLDEDDTARPWSLVACGIEALVRSSTRPVDGSGQ